MAADLKSLDSILEKREKECLDKSLTRSQIQEGYNKWAGKYDQEMHHEFFMAPVGAARALAEVIPEAERPTIRILDVGCGTGRVGEELHRLGFRRIHGVDPNWKMVTELLPKGIYRQVTLVALGEQQDSSEESAKNNSELPDEFYDAVVLAGAFTHGHVPYTAIFDMLKTCKKGGVIVMSIRQMVLTDHGEYSLLEPTLDRMEKEGKWKLEKKEQFDNYWRSYPGMAFTYRKC